ncbi:MAG: hypothetical protein HWD59_14335 [Coxiellaceae bacterium]|nr:MAG: hypothetical protein HWD59_14335 [Coxiellaceae bacterium]
MEILDACYQLRVIESKKAIQQMLGEMPTDPDKFDAMMKQFYDENANDDPTPEMMKQFYDENANDDPTPELK